MYLFLLLFLSGAAHDDFKAVANSTYKVREAARQRLLKHPHPHLLGAVQLTESKTPEVRAVAKELLNRYHAWYADLSNEMPVMPWIDALTPSLFPCIEEELPPKILRPVGMKNYVAATVVKHYLDAAMKDTPWVDGQETYHVYRVATKAYVADLMRDGHGRAEVLQMLTRMHEIDALWRKHTYPPPVLVPF